MTSNQFAFIIVTIVVCTAVGMTMTLLVYYALRSYLTGVKSYLDYIKIETAKQASWRHSQGEQAAPNQSAPVGCPCCYGAGKLHGMKCSLCNGERFVARSVSDRYLKKFKDHPYNKRK